LFCLFTVVNLEIDQVSVEKPTLYSVVTQATPKLVPFQNLAAAYCIACTLVLKYASSPHTALRKNSNKCTILVFCP